MHPGACGASFHAIQTFNIKLSATAAAVQFTLAEDARALDEWEKIQKKAQKKSQRRNEFVHFSTFIMYNETDPNEKIRLEPQIYDWRHIATRPKFRLSEITEISERFIDLANELRRFRNKIPDASQKNEAASGAPRPGSPRRAPYCSMSGYCVVRTRSEHAWRQSRTIDRPTGEDGRPRVRPNMASCSLDVRASSAWLC
jgi:hypothetical protein